MDPLKENGLKIFDSYVTHIFNWFYTSVVSKLVSELPSLWYRSARNRRCASIKIASTPPTAQTPVSNELIFWRATPHEIAFRGTEAIFEFRPWSWDTKLKLGHFSMFPPFLNGPDISMFIPNISAPRQKFKNRLGAPESIPMMSFSPKNQPIWHRRLGCRGGC